MGKWLQFSLFSGSGALRIVAAVGLRMFGLRADDLKSRGWVGALGVKGYSGYVILQNSREDDNAIKHSMSEKGVDPANWRIQRSPKTLKRIVLEKH